MIIHKNESWVKAKAPVSSAIERFILSESTIDQLKLTICRIIIRISAIIKSWIIYLNHFSMFLKNIETIYYDCLPAFWMWMSLIFLDIVTIKLNYILVRLVCVTLTMTFLLFSYFICTNIFIIIFRLQILISIRNTLL